ncbi:hypothetical protein COD86_29645 [Bacillus cereus]|nr:hypothetical protein COD14_31530 [Bacillus cereus]PGV87921.1 hypothetical protein COD86_29645 [Bacillus cereus]
MKLEIVIDSILFSCAIYTTVVFFCAIILLIFGVNSVNFKPQILGQDLVHVYIIDGYFFVKYTWMGFFLCIYLGGIIGVLKNKYIKKEGAIS